ncbi:protease modulator HflC [Ferrimonas balearica]|uniref:protease modulator HflC n=1 Tax=Ferrimonas balearica TaxID=44012 RepID=UPI001C595C6B|nr:protease modulator HflC [Ferrimonas balearica]MBW3140524.1 protease modulator HflC [Ferrimonas balearica]MBW3165482.1 protease modulator HflC [Ferrimonas balearica]MBY5981304.1 protease modulator HflC [Ferrimonas balearica]MBY6107662.1 protease modulator HflC [Ferrimonas balearica]MBY6226620.1 protease modulator HflC [Ferrimonas balearica]
MRPVSLILLVAVLFAGFSSLFVVEEGERAIVKRFGVIQKNSEGETQVYEPGLRFKVPLLDQVFTLNARILTLDAEADRFVTSEQKDLMVDSYVKWRITDFGKFYLATQGNQLLAESLLQSKINNGLRSEFGSRTIREIVSGSRDELQQEALRATRTDAAELGIEVVDVRVKQINLPREVSEFIYDRMRAQREAVARAHRSEGQEKAEVIRAGADARATVILAEAERKSRTLRGEGDGAAAKIYADTYGQNPEFYALLRSLDAYKASFRSKDDVLVISPDSEFFQFMNSKVR